MYVLFLVFPVTSCNIPFSCICFNILLIDEATNQMDHNLERKILKNIFELYNDKTIIVVSHRNENMDLFDKVITLEKGKVKECLFKNV